MTHGVRHVLVVAAVLLGVTACDSGSSDRPTPFSRPCLAEPQGGHLCIKMFASNGSVRDVVGYLSSTDSPLQGTRWRLTLDTFTCDPGTGITPSCRATHSYPGAARRGAPPIETSCRQPDGSTDTTSPGCHDTLASAYASVGDWPRFDVSGKGYVVREKTWFCISEQVASAGKWTSPSPALRPTAARACSAVSPA